MKLTGKEITGLKLVLRSPDMGDGWRQCSKNVYDSIIRPLTREIFEKDEDNLRVRLTTEGEVVSKWLV